ncbi:MAG: hypothetical protein OEM01_03180 [Desulfobulbaceae bacterium]|nr:hypothetical protein [Desulfobulbaceae bacterium]
MAKRFDDFISIDYAKPNIGKLKAQEEVQKIEINDTEKLLKTIPDPKTVKRKTKLAQNTLRVITNRIKTTEKYYHKMKWEDKRKLVQTIFSGHDTMAIGQVCTFLFCVASLKSISLILRKAKAQIL